MLAPVPAPTPKYHTLIFPTMSSSQHITQHMDEKPPSGPSASGAPHRHPSGSPQQLNSLPASSSSAGAGAGNGVSPTPHISLELSFQSASDPYNRELGRMKTLFPIPPGCTSTTLHKCKSNDGSSGRGQTSHAAAQSRRPQPSPSSAFQQQHKSSPSPNSLPLILQKYPNLLSTIESLTPLSQNNSFSCLKRLSLQRTSTTERHDAIQSLHLRRLIYGWLLENNLHRVAELMQKEGSAPLHSYDAQECPSTAPHSAQLPNTNSCPNSKSPRSKPNTPAPSNSLLKQFLLLAMDEQQDHILQLPQSVKDERRFTLDAEVQTSQIYAYAVQNQMADQVHTHIWDEGPDIEHVNVLYGKDHKSLHAATLNKLVQRITDSAVNTDYRNTFMETYRSFTSPETILRKLFERYNVPTHVKSQTKNIVKTRVIQLLKLWIKDYFMDWNEGMLRSLEKFMDDHLRKEYPRFIAVLQANVDRLRRGEVQRMITIGSSSVEKPLIALDQLLNSDLTDIYSIHVEEIARQMTIVEHSIYRRIRSTELLNQAWNNKSLRHRSPNVLELIQRFNRISQWVSSEVVAPESLAARIERYEFFVRVAQKLWDPLHNYNAMLAICSGLQNASVNRLKHTKRGVDEELRESLQEMLQSMSTDESYKEFRRILREATPPKLPYLGMFLTDITFIEEGNSDFVESKTKPGNILINWSKRCMVYRVIKQIRDYQNYDYTQYFAPIHQIQTLIEKSIQSKDMVTGDDLFEMSKKREPKRCKLSSIVP